MLNQMSPEMLLQVAIQRCKDPKMRQLLVKAQSNPKQGVEELCKEYPSIAQTIDTAIGNGQDPKSMVMNGMGYRKF